MRVTAWLKVFSISLLLSTSFFSNTFALNETVFEMDFSEAQSEVIPGEMLKAAEGAFQLNKKGLDMLDSGRLDAALINFEMAAERLPGYSDAVNNQGVVYYRKGLIGRAAEIWESITRSDKEYVLSYYNLGIAEYNKKEYEKARDMFKKALDIRKRFVEALVMLGKCELMLGDGKNALDKLEKAWKILPGSDFVWGNYAYSLLMLRDTSTARNVLLEYPDNAEALKLLGIINMEKGELERARNILLKALEMGAKPEVMIRLAFLDLKKGNPEQTLQTLDSYFSKEKNPEADAFLIAGIAAKENDCIERSRKFFEKGIKRYPDDPLLRYNLGQIYFNMKLYKKAESVWRIISDTLNDPDIFYKRAISARYDGDRKKAESLINKAIDLDEKAEYFDLLGVIKHEEGDDRRAEELFRKALKLNPGLKRAQMNIAVVSKSEKELEVSLEQLQKEADTCKNACGKVLFRLSVINYYLGRYQRAAEIIESIPVSERNPEIIRHLAIYYREMKQYDKAIGILEKAEKEYVLEPQIRHELARDYFKAGYNRKAVKTLKGLLGERGMKAWRLYYQTGSAFLEMNNLDSAAYYFKKSIKTSRDNNPAATGMLAFVYKRMGEDKQAGELWVENAERDPDNSVTWINLGLLMQKQGRYDKAIENFMKALRLSPDNSAIYINIGNAYFSKHEFKKAIMEYSKAMDSEKRDAAAFNLLLAAQRLGDMVRAEKMNRLLQKEYSDTDYARRAAAKMKFVSGDYDGAKSLILKIRDRDDYDRYELAEIYIKTGEYKKAGELLENLPKNEEWENRKIRLYASIAFSQKQYENAYKLLTQLKHNTFEGRYNLAVAAFKTGRYKNTITLCKDIVNESTGEDRQQIYLMTGHSAFKLEQWEKALSWYKQLIGLGYNDPVVYYNTAVTLFKLDEADKAWDYYNRAVTLDPSLKNKELETARAGKSGETAEKHNILDSVDALYNKAIDYQQDGNDSMAKELYLRVIKADSSFKRAWNNLGAVYSSQGLLDSAEQCCLKSIERNYDIPEAYANLVSIYIAREQFDKAGYWLFKGKGHNPESDVLLMIEKKLEKAKAQKEKE